MWYCNCHCKWFLSRRLRMRSKGECRDPTSLLCMERRRRWCQLWLSRRLWGNLCKEMMMIACKVHELCVKQCHPRADYWGSFCLLLLSAVVQKQIFRWCRNGHLCTISFRPQPLRLLREGAKKIPTPLVHPPAQPPGARCISRTNEPLLGRIEKNQWKTDWLCTATIAASTMVGSGLQVWPFAGTPLPALLIKAICSGPTSKRFCLRG